MKKVLLTLLALACLSVCTTQAKTLPLPAEPNEACSEAWQKYKNGDTLWKTGWGLLGAGLGVGTGGGLLFVYGRPYFRIGSSGPDPLATSAFSLFCLGAGAVVAAVPCLIVGQVRRKSAIKSYQENCVQEQITTFKIQSSSDGIGLAIQF